ncbi:hypothetical protein ACGFR8_07725 [Streptomyces brevispora]|uniref:hypothetical protein n=1 Tax=Streptomyces brevispora TaxID=887462 RepID=UPI003717E969
MRKIPTLFNRELPDLRHVLPTVHPDCAWVLAGEGTATRKWDGICVSLDGAGAWWARREVKPGKTPPSGYQLVAEDPITGKCVGWEPIEQSGFASFHAQALANTPEPRAGTYELLGPKINRNPDGFDEHVLMAHGWSPFSVRQDYATAPRDYDGLRPWLQARPYEGIVWHHPDGRMAKLKVRDFPAAADTDQAESAM